MRPPFSGLRQGAPNPIVVGRKFCSMCGRWRLKIDFRPALQWPIGVRPYCLTCERLLNRAKKRAMSPQQLERRREYQRFWMEAKRRRAGVKPRKFLNKSWIGDRTGGSFRLPREPIVEAMERYRHLQRMNGHPDYEWADLARECGLSERALLRYRTGESKRISLDSADRISIAIDVPLSILYPLEEVS